MLPSRNIASNLASQLYVALVGIALVPLYIRYMGAEAFGLVGFYGMLQAWFQVLDMGLAPTMGRETARFRGGAIDATSLRRLLRILEKIYVGTALLGALAIVAGAGVITSDWLKVQHLPLEEVQRAIVLMAVVIAMRWVTGLYRGMITGLERLVWLGGFNVAVATTRFLLVVPFLIYVDASPTAFFSYQLVVAVIEVVVLVTQTNRWIPKGRQGAGAQTLPLRRILRFSLSIAFTSSVWVAVTHADKLVLSKLLSLTNYAYFTIAVVVASAVSVASGPIGGALLPRFSKLVAENNDSELVRTYRNATQLVAVVAVPIALILAAFPDKLLWAWTGDVEIVRNAAPILSLYALGNGLLALAAFPYYLQFARGDLRLHVVGSIIFVLVLVPGLVWATWTHGVIGAGYAWLIANCLHFFFWVPLVHRRLLKGLHCRWLLRDVASIAVAPLAAVAVMHGLDMWPEGRALLGLSLGTLALFLFLIAAGGSGWGWSLIQTVWGARRRLTN